jgi:hypothetical protein
MTYPSKAVGYGGDVLVLLHFLSIAGLPELTCVVLKVERRGLRLRDGLQHSNRIVEVGDLTKDT